MMKKTTKRFTAFAVVMMLVVSCFSMTAFAAEPNSNDMAVSVSEATPNNEIMPRGTWPAGDQYLGYCNITEGSHLGGSHQFVGNSMRVKPCWKPLDDTSKEVDMYIEVRDMTTGGNAVYHHLFTISEDTDGRKDNGYWYAVGAWFDINPTHTYRIYYEPFTSAGYSGTGRNRTATCVMYADIK